MINTLIRYMGIDSNTFWLIIATIISPFYKFIKYGFENRQWKMQGKVKGTFFYPIILGLTFIVELLEFVVYISIISCLELNRLENVVISIMSLIAVVMTNIHILNRNKFVKRRTVGKKILIMLVDVPTVLIATALWLSCYGGGFTNIADLCKLLILLADFVGMLIFGDEGIMYENSYVDIRINSSEQMKGIDIEKIQKSGKYLIINSKTSKQIILIESIVSIEYYGKPKFIVSEGVLQKRKKWIKEKQRKTVMRKKNNEDKIVETKKKLKKCYKNEKQTKIEQYVHIEEAIKALDKKEQKAIKVEYKRDLKIYERIDDLRLTLIFVFSGLSLIISVFNTLLNKLEGYITLEVYREGILGTGKIVLLFMLVYMVIGWWKEKELALTEYMLAVLEEMELK